MFLNAFKVTVSGAGTVLLSTVTSCAFAVVIESAAHRVQYRFFPHWYKDVQCAIGLPNLLNDQWHQKDQEQQLGDNNKHDHIEDDDSTTQSEDQIVIWDGSEHKIEISDQTRIGIINLDDNSFHDDFREENATQFQMYEDQRHGKKDFIDITGDLVLSCAMTG